MEKLWLLLALIPAWICLERLVYVIFMISIRRDGILDWYPAPPRRTPSSSPAPNHFSLSSPPPVKAPFWSTSAELLQNSR